MPAFLPDSDCISREHGSDSTDISLRENLAWLELFQPFTHVKTVHVFEQLVPDIVDALAAENTVAGVLPELSRLYLKGYRDSPSVAKAADQFVAARKHSGRTVSLFN